MIRLDAKDIVVSSQESESLESEEVKEDDSDSAQEELGPRREEAKEEPPAQIQLERELVAENNQDGLEENVVEVEDQENDNLFNPELDPINEVYSFTSADFAEARTEFINKSAIARATQTGASRTLLTQFKI